MVWGSFDGWIEPVSSDRRASSARAGSAPMTRVPGDRPLAASAVPDSRPPPPVGTDDHVKRSRLLDQLESGGPLAGDHVPVVERVNECQTVPVDLGGDGGLAVGQGRLAGHDPGPIALGGLAFHGGCGPRHHHRHRHAEQLAGQGQGLRVIARGVRDHAGPLPGLVELKDCVDGPAELERADLLEVLALEEDGAAATRVDRPAGHHGRAVDPRRNPLGCCEYVLISQRDRGGFLGREAHLSGAPLIFAQ